VDKALKMADNAKDEIIAGAREEHARLLEAAQEKIARERQQALEDIRGEVVAISVAAAAKIIGQSIDEKINARLVDDFITRMECRKTRRDAAMLSKHMATRYAQELYELASDKNSLRRRIFCCNWLKSTETRICRPSS